MMQLLGRLALSLCLLTAVAGEDEDLRLPKCRYVKTAGHLLYGRNTFELQNVRLSKCKRVCNQKQEQCRSFDYNRELKLCFLSDRTKTTDPEHFGNHPKFAYFERQCGPTTTTPTTTTTTTTSTTTDDEASSVCPPDYFTCNSGFQCIRDIFQCDGDWDCADRSDEYNCAQFGCQYYCYHANECIRSIQVCDGFNNCGDYEDELGCPK